MAPLRIVLCLAVCVLLQACRYAPYYVEKGNKLFESGKYSEASLNYRKALQKDPEFGIAYFRLGLSERKQQHYPAAWENLNRAVTLLPRRDDVKIELGELCLIGLVGDSRRPKNLYNQLKEISSQLLSSDPSSFAGLRFRGYIAFLEKHSDEAVMYFARAHELRPLEPDVAISLVEALFQSNQGPRAEHLGREFIQASKGYGPAYDALYSHYLETGRTSDAEQILKLKIANNPDQPSFITQLARFYWNLGQQHEALSLVSKLGEPSGTRTETHLVAGDFYAGIEDWDDAIKQFQEGIRVGPAQELVFRKRIANVQLVRGNKSEAARLIDQILKQQPGDQEALRIRAGLRLDSREGAAVAGAMEDYKTLLRQNSRDPRDHFGLGRAFQIKGDFPSAKAEFRQAIQLDASYAAPRLALTEIALAQHRSDEAIQCADIAISANSSNTAARLLKALALREAGRLDDARFELEHVIQTAPQERSAYLQLALLEIEQKNFKKAEAIFAKLQNFGDDLSGAAAGLAVLYSKQGQIDKAYAMLKKELDHSPAHLLVHELLATVAMQAQQYDRAISEYRIILLVNSNQPIIHLRLAEAFRLKGDFTSYISTLERAQKLFPNDLLVNVLLASAIESVGRQGDAVRLYRHAQELQPDDPRVLNNLAFVIVETKGNIDEALRLAQLAVKKSPNQPNFSDTLGWIYLKKNLTDSAIQIFDSLVSKHPDEPTFRYHLGTALLQKGDVQGARHALQVALENKPAKNEADQIRELLAQLN